MTMPVKSTTNFSSSNSLAPNDVYEGRGELVHKHIFPVVSVDLSCRLSYIELTKLYRMIEKALPHIHHRVVQFISPNREQGVSDIALQTAIMAARLIGKRVLFIDTAVPLSSKRARRSSTAPDTSLEALLLSGGSPYEAIAQAAGTELYFARLCKQGEEGLAPVSLSTIENAVENLRPYFDMIIVDSQAVLNDAFGMGLAKLADGSVMIVEAERTRGPVAAECKRLIESSGGNIIGAIMNRRRLYIPDFLYRVLYQRDTL